MQISHFQSIKQESVTAYNGCCFILQHLQEKLVRCPGSSRIKRDLMS